ncbi:EcsC family protein [Anaerotignum sp.]|uniref:EcsC family protein n=1 Tax=Anaerotignum sp. TaxID=2039241 RepID=UPI0028A99A52|nr:EcsC family protein [Anaerotignum sp.]
MAKGLEKEFKKIVAKEETKFKKIEKKAPNQGTSKLDGLKQTMEEKIPDKLIHTLDEGFNKAFHLIFSKGIGVIEKTFKEDELALEFSVNDFRVEQRPNSKSLRKLDKGIKKGHLINTCTTVVEGIGLGAIGVGLPDIPLFLGMLLKGIYETAIGYGYDYKEEKEQILILRMITAALSQDENKREADERVEKWIGEINSKDDLANATTNLEDEIRLASKALSSAMLLSKFLQGFLIVGMVGGIANPFIYQKVMKYVTVKYKKRYINEKRTSIKNER